MRNTEVEYFKELLETRKIQIKSNISSVEAEMEELKGLELNDEGDYASASNDNLVENAIGNQQELELLEIDQSLSKIKNKEYGICEMCEELIGTHRLKVKPHAKYCIECREIAEKQSK